MHQSGSSIEDQRKSPRFDLTPTKWQKIIHDRQRGPRIHDLIQSNTRVRADSISNREIPEIEWEQQWQRERYGFSEFMKRL